MNSNRDILEDQLQRYEAQLKGFNSYVKELKDKTAELGTDKEQFETDLLEAEYNVSYYEDEMARVKKELGASDKAPRLQASADAILPQTVKQGVGSLIFSSISFVAGAIIGSTLMSRRGGKDAREEKRGG
jgi:chromosome segregation ATPase